MRGVRVRAELSGAGCGSAGGPTQSERSLAGLARGDTEASGPDSAGDRLLLLLSPRSFVPPQNHAALEPSCEQEAALIPLRPFKVKAQGSHFNDKRF